MNKELSNILIAFGGICLGMLIPLNFLFGVLAVLVVLYWWSDKKKKDKNE